MRGELAAMRLRVERERALGVLKALLAACVIVPIALLGYAALSIDADLHRQAERRLDIELDVLTQHALKVFQTAELALQAIRMLTSDLGEAEVRARELPLHTAMVDLSQGLTGVQSVWLIGRDGRPLVSSLVAPLPPIDTTHRDYFRALSSGDPGLFIGAVTVPTLPGPNFFAYARRRPSPDGSFNGVLVVSMKPDDFERFYARLDPEGAQTFTMARTDGAVLARFPAPSRPGQVLDPGRSPLLRAIAENPQGQHLVAASSLDGITRIVAYRPVPGYPLYVVAGVSTASIHAQVWVTLLGHMMFGVPATVLLLLTTAIAIRRTQRLHSEADKREAAEQALARRQRLEAIGELTGGVAHDFNNLLMIIRGSNELLRRRVSDARDIRSLDIIEATVQRGAALTRQLLTFASRQALAVDVVDLAKYLPKFRDLLRRSLSRDIQVEVSATEATCRVKVDPGELELALLNIGVNARDAMPSGGRLVVRARTAMLTGAPETDGLVGAFVAISLADTGAGIAPEALPRVFEPFFTTKAVGKGTGLGLSQVYGFARQSGGTVSIESQPGAGTTVTIYLPTTSEAVAAPGPTDTPARGRAGAGRRVLMVEDNFGVGDVQRQLLQDEGFSLDWVVSARDALDRLEGGHDYDLVLSDVMMPGEMDGIDLARELRRRRPALPVILISGYSSGAEQAIREGFRFVQKPYDLATLREAIASALPEAAPATVASGGQP